MRKFRSALSHIGVIFSGVFLTLVILNRYNPAMGFLTSTISQIFILIYCLTVLMLAISTIADNRRYTRHMNERAEEAARWKKYGSNLQRPPQK